MSVVTLQLGQCGNQLGQELFESLSKDNRNLSTFFRDSLSSQSNIARAVLIDMEPKVVSRCQKETENGIQWSYDSNRRFSKQSGSGNNWALGYNVHGPNNFDTMGNLIRQEVEACDRFSGCLLLQSVAGGTGSGLGTYITEQLQEYFSSSFILNTVVWPYHSGEVIVQNYNALATMSCLSEVSDGIIVIQNDIANLICTKLLNIARPSFADINRVIAGHLSSVLMSCKRMEQEGFEYKENYSPLRDIIQNHCSHSGYKMLDIRAIPQMPENSKAFSSYTWSGLMKHLHQMHIADSALEEGIDWSINVDKNFNEDKKYSWNSMNRSVSCSLYIRGVDSAAVDYSAFKDKQIYAEWNTDPFSAFYSTRTLDQSEKTAALLSNSQSIVKPLDMLLERSHEMMTSKAYLHQYERHGVERDFFIDAFQELEQVLENYKSLSYH